jgi:hypothetical protein
MKKTCEEGNISVFGSRPWFIFSARQCSSHVKCLSKSIPTGQKFCFEPIEKNRLKKTKPPGYEGGVSTGSEALIFEQRATHGVRNSSKRWRWIWEKNRQRTLTLLVKEKKNLLIKKIIIILFKKRKRPASKEERGCPLIRGSQPPGWGE